MDLAAPSNEFENKIISNLAIYGYQLNNINRDKETNEPPFSYSVGFWKSYGHPEVLIIGLHATTVASVIDKLAVHLKNGGAHYKPGNIHAELIDGFDTLFLPVDAKVFEDYLLSTVWLYKGTDFPVLQLVFQDENNSWPWDERASENFKANQTIVGDVGFVPEMSVTKKIWKSIFGKS